MSMGLMTPWWIALSMLIQGFRKDEDIINVDNGKTGEWIENLIHDILEFRGCGF